MEKSKEKMSAHLIVFFAIIGLSIGITVGIIMIHSLHLYVPKTINQVTK